jgi:ribonuclease BN (tRNA processing enzyme)
MQFSVFPVRHHEFHSAYGLALRGGFLYTGDTRPVPEVVNNFSCHGEIIFHDCCIQSNPSHTSIDELDINYRAEQLERMIFYHYESKEAAALIQDRGYQIAKKNQQYLLRHHTLSCHTGIQPVATKVTSEVNHFACMNQETGV